MKCLSLFIACFLVISCKSSQDEQQTASEIVDSSIEVAGGDQIASSIITFDFRDKHYKATRNIGSFQLERHFVDSTSHRVSSIKDVLNNNGFQRFVDDLLLEIPDSMATKYAASVNSVHYFSVLPYGLNDNAVNKTPLEDRIIKGKSYSAIQVTFDQDGGGEDFEDVFVYWINKNTNKVDYLAYSYNEDHGKGLRFREAYNERYVEGIRFVDYNNYKPNDSSIDLTELPQLFEKGKLILLSKIELENIKVASN